MPCCCFFPLFFFFSSNILTPSLLLLLLLCQFHASLTRLSSDRRTRLEKPRSFGGGADVFRVRRATANRTTQVDYSGEHSWGKFIDCGWMGEGGTGVGVGGVLFIAVHTTSTSSSDAGGIEVKD